MADGGFFVLRQQVFDYLDEVEDLVEHAIARAAAEGRLLAIPYHGFWAPNPWMLWRNAASPAPRQASVVEVPDIAPTASLPRLAV